GEEDAILPARAPSSRRASVSFFRWGDTVGCDRPSGSIRWHTHTGPSLVASMFTIRTRAGSARALNTAAVAPAWSSDSVPAANGPQHPTGSATLRLTANSSYRQQSIYRRA